MVGRTISASASSLTVRDGSTPLSSSSATLSVDLALASTATTLKIKDSSGAVKKSIDLGAHAAGSFAVDLSKVGSLAAGTYTIEVAGKTSDGADTTGTTTISGAVDALEFADGSGRFRIGPFNVSPGSITSVGASAQ
jgi:flagellar hook assembly protein FlgD